MSMGLYSHTTRAVGTTLTAAIYNADHVNHITNHNPSMMGGYSDTVEQMQITASPGGIGSESLATNMAGELARIRYVIQRFLGASQWYEDVGTAVGTNSTNQFTITQAIIADLVNLVLTRTENDAVERELLSLRSGSGAGDRGSLRLVGDASNGVAALRWLIGDMGYGLIPVGTWLPYGGDTPPKDWLWAAGQAVSRTTYSRLYSVFGTKFGAGNGTSTFNVIDLRGTVNAGLDNMGGSSADRVTNANADAIGGRVGAQTHTMTIAEMPSHDHSVGADDIESSGSGMQGGQTRGWSSVSRTGFTGGGAAHNNMQPTIFSPFIIYAGQS